MSRRVVGRRWALAGASAALLAVCVPQVARAGTYTVGSCEADPTSKSTEAFAMFATRGMRITQACSHHGEGFRGVMLGNAVRKGSVRAGSKAELALTAPGGTRLVGFRWAGAPIRSDCRYALQIWAEVPGQVPVGLLNVRANRPKSKCPKKGRAQAAQINAKDFQPLPNASRLVFRVTCVGGDGRKSCSTAGQNAIRATTSEVQLEDVQAPAVTMLHDTPLTTGAWVNADAAVNYDASDNAGVRAAQVLYGGVPRVTANRPCRFAYPELTFPVPVPCPNGPGQIPLSVGRWDEGTHELSVRAIDPSGNTVDATPVTARIDHTAPDRVDVSVEGGSEWRNRNDFAAAWTNPVEVDRAPIVAASYKLCPIAGGECTSGEQTGQGISRLAAPVPAPGEWTISLVRRDEASNQSEKMASVPVTLRYDPEPPQLAFEPSVPSDPTLVAVKVSDRLSGVANGAIEISRAGSGVWKELAAQRDGERLLARIDDAALPPGPYELRARAVDQAHNEASTNLRVDGQPMALTLPLRVVSALQNAFEREHTVRQQVRRGGRTRTVRRRVVVQTQTARVLFGESAQVIGRLVAPDGSGIPGADIQILASTPIGPEQQVGVVQTDAEGRYRYTAPGTSNQTLRFLYAGSATVLASGAQLAMTVPAASDLRVDRPRLRNGQTVTFSGPVRTLPTPPGGKLVEMQVKLPGRWETFRTIRSDDAGQWSVRYHFRRTVGVQHYRFRARLPAEGAYPFTTGVSRVVTVRVRGA